ncbi:hypothetical protein DPMN_168843 [Dreissena polymorpha]|uniref:Uncharacterized protein n=1 Tax=Dreissena polymorpha TaxID=45954 RepID=A0A9D4J008_DREPO|nr:hypothetical protein DPMN_168843 [Dreissena polymorpha]
MEKASGDEEELPMETDVFSVIAPEDDPSTSSVFTALNEVGQFSVFDEVGQCEDTPLIKATLFLFEATLKKKNVLRWRGLRSRLETLILG